MIINAIFLFVLILAQNLPAHSQDLTILFKDGNSQSIPIDQIKSITFESSNKAIQNIAPLASVEASSEFSQEYKPSNAVDGIKGIHTKGEWSSLNEPKGAWIILKWSRRYKISEIVLYDRPNLKDQIFKCALIFSDGSSMIAGPLSNDGSPTGIKFSSKNIEWVKLEILDAEGRNAGISEIEVYGR